MLNPIETSNTNKNHCQPQQPYGHNPVEHTLIRQPCNCLIQELRHKELEENFRSGWCPTNYFRRVLQADLIFSPTGTGHRHAGDPANHFGVADLFNGALFPS
jgi:hypothetical protein